MAVAAAAVAAAAVVAAVVAAAEWLTLCCRPEYSLPLHQP